MILLINTADVNQIEVALAKSEKIISKKNIKAKYKQAEKLLPAVLDLLKNAPKSGRHGRAAAPTVLRGIAVVTGPGSFSALRIGISTANTIGWTLKIPVAGIMLNEFKNLDELSKIASAKLRKVKVSSVVKPFYGQEPNITVKSK